MIIHTQSIALQTPFDDVYYNLVSPLPDCQGCLLVDLTENEVIRRQAVKTMADKKVLAVYRTMIPLDKHKVCLLSLSLSLSHKP
jgi:hypothetical protein